MVKILAFLILSKTFLSFRKKLNENEPQRVVLHGQGARTQPEGTDQQSRLDLHRPLSSHLAGGQFTCIYDRPLFIVYSINAKGHKSSSILSDVYFMTPAGGEHGGGQDDGQ